MTFVEWHSRNMLEVPGIPPKVVGAGSTMGRHFENVCGHDKDPIQLGFECSDMLRRKFNSL